MTPEELQDIIDYLADGNPLVWQASLTRIERVYLNSFSYRRGDCTLFRGSRAHGGLQLYGWGCISFHLTRNERASIGSLFSTATNIGASDYSVLNPVLFPIPLAGTDPYNEAFPTGSPLIDARTDFTWIGVLPHVPTTEEFFGESAPHASLQNIACIASCIQGLQFNIAAAPRLQTVLVCTTEGALYAAGRADQGGADGEFLGNVRYNELGLGKLPPYPLGSSPFEQTGISGVNRASAASPNTQTVLQRVYGDDPSFFNVKFVKTQVSPTAGFALDDQGVIWMSGRVDLFAEAADFPENSTDLDHFRPRHVTQYYDKTATLVSGSLAFRDFWVPGSQIIAITTDNRMFMLGNSARFSKVVNTTIWHEVGGFVDTVSITDEGVYFNGAFNQATFQSITFSAPDDPYGVTATGTAIRTGSGIDSRLKAIRIDNPGWGYANPPTITINRGPGSPPAGFVEGTADCTIYTGGWKTAAAGGSASPFEVYSAINEDGIIYFWGTGSYPPGPLRMQGIISASNLNGVPQPALYEKVVLNRASFGNTTLNNRCFGVALDADGKVSFFSPGGSSTSSGLSPTLDRTPELELTLLSSVDATLGSYSFIDASCTSRTVALVRDDGVVFTYGALGQIGGFETTLFNAPALGQGKDTYSSDANDTFYGRMRTMRPIMGAAKFTRVFGVLNVGGPPGGFFAIREPEELDPMYGTRINPLPLYENPAP